jgi:hypothetical protein
MNMKISTLVLGVTAAFTLQVASADELLLTSSSAKKGSTVAVDYVSDGASVGVQLEIMVPAGGKLDLSRFARSLPAGFVLESNVVDNKLIAIIVNDSSKPMPAGVISLGVISSSGGKGEFRLDSVGSFDAKANQIAVKSTRTDASK